MPVTPPARAVLDGVRVLELARYSPVAYATMILGDLGADVVKVEPVAGSPLGGTALSTPGGHDPAEAVWLNRNKRSVTLDLKSEPGAQALRDLAAGADVVVEGFRPGVLPRLGLGYPELSAVNPRLVLCSLTGYGQTGPYAELPGHDLNYLGHAAVLELMPGPAWPLNLVADLAGGSHYAVMAILAALLWRDRSGAGQHLDLSFTDGALALLGATSMVRPYLRDRTAPDPGHGLHGGAFPYYNAYRASDGGHVTVCCTEDRHWESLCAALDRPDLTAAGPRPRDRTSGPSAVQAAALVALRELFATRSRNEWFEALSARGVPVGRSYQVPELAEDPHLRHRGMVRPGPPMEIGSPLRIDGAAPERGGPAPGRGEHTDELLAELGYDGEYIRTLRDKGVV